MTPPLSITLYLLHTDTDSDGAQLSHHLTKRARDLALLETFAPNGSNTWARGYALLGRGTEEDDQRFIDLIRETSEKRDPCATWTTEEIEIDVSTLLTGLMAKVESAHFRTVTDTGANPNAMVIWNALRRAAGLPGLSKDDLPAHDETRDQYVCPEGSRLLVKPAPYPARA